MYPPDQHSPYFDPDTPSQWTYAMRVDAARNEHESPTHIHRMGQLVLSLQGGVTSFVPQGLWMVPPGSAVWIPGGVPHSNRVTDNGRVCFLFVPADTPGLPAQCCTLAVTPLVREMVAYLADLPPAATGEPANRRLAGVLVDLLAQLPTEQLHLPLSDLSLIHI